VLNKLFLSIIFLAGSLASTGHAQVEYVKICSLYGEAFHFIPGTDICVNEQTGQTREQTTGGTWVSQIPTNNQGHWATVPALECGLGRLVQVGTYKSSDFTENVYSRYQTAPTAFSLRPGEFISRLIMSGGFDDPIQPLSHSPGLTANQFCLRVADPHFVTIDNGGQPLGRPFCNIGPLACISNNEILGTPAVYSVPVLGALLVHYNTDSNGRVMGSPSTCGSQFIVTTGMGTYNPTAITDPSNPTNLISPGGTLSVWACIQQGIQ
jgi:hypothetical protein